MPRITARLIDSIHSENKDIIIRDNELKGFLCKITPKCKKVYMLYYRTKSGRERKPSLGVHGHITCYQAREMAKVWLAEVSKGNDPYETIEKGKISPTVEELSGKHLETVEEVRQKNSLYWLKRGIICPIIT